MNWKTITSVLGTATMLSLVCPIPATASEEFTQREYLEWLAKASARTANLPANPTTADYLSWAVARGITPKGGWQPEAPLTREVYAQTLAQLYGLSDELDPLRALLGEGVVVPSTNLISRATVLAEIGNVGFNSVTAINSLHPLTPIHPAHKVFVCHNGRTIEIARSAVPAHLAQGDYLGACR